MNHIDTSALVCATSRRKLLIAGAGAAVSTAFIGAPAFAQVRKLRYSLPWLAAGNSAFVYAAKHHGFLAKQGIDIDISRGFGSVATAQAINAGQFDIGAIFAATLVMSVAQGMPLLSLGAIEQDSVMGICVLGNSPITKPSDLPGKKIGAVPTSAEFPFFPAYCKKAGIDISKIEIVQLDSKVLERALMEKQVDAIMGIAGSSIPVLASRGEKVRFMTYRSVGVPTYGSLITIAKKSYAADPGLYDATITGLMEALKFTLLDPEASRDIFFKAVPEITLSPTGKEATIMAMGLQAAAIVQADVQTHPLGWMNTSVFSGIADMVMEYAAKPGMTKPMVDEIVTNKAIGKVTMTPSEWARVAANNKQYLSMLT